jgi:hypothetical protein
VSGFEFVTPQLAAGGCLKYGYTDEMRTDTRMQATRFVRIDNKIKALDVFDSSFNKPQTNYSFNLTASPSLYDGINRNDARYTPLCSYHNGFSFTSAGCTRTAISSDTISCSCDGLHQFVYGVIDIPTRPPPSTATVSPEPTGTPGPVPKAQAPIVQSAEFASTGAFIVVRFDKPVSMIKDNAIVPPFKNIPCSYLMVTNSTANGLLGLGESDCNVQVNFEGTQMIIRPSPALAGNANVIVPGQSIAFLNETITSQGTMNSFKLSGSVVVNAPSSPEVPSVRIAGPAKIDTCPDLIFKVLVGAGKGGRKWKSVTASVTPSGIAVPALVARVNEIAAALQNGTAQNPMISKAILPAQSYVFSFTFTNFLNAATTATYSLEKISAGDQPLVEFIIPNGDVDFSRKLKIKAIVTPPKCLTAVGVNFAWTSTDFVVSNENLGSSYVIESNTLAPSTTYTINLTASFEGMTPSFRRSSLQI